MDVVSLVVTVILGIISIVIALMAFLRPRIPLEPIPTPEEIEAINDARNDYLEFVVAELQYLEFRGVVRLDRLILDSSLKKLRSHPA